MLISETVILTLPFVFVVLYIVFNHLISNKKSVCIVVLGDIGRSPRMQYHAISFVNSGFTVDIVGYPGSDIQQELKESENVTVHHIREVPKHIQKLPKLIAYLIKVLWMTASLLLTLLLIPKCGFIMLQNPPCIPTMFVSLVVCLLRGGQLVIDWHNYGYTILSMALRPSHPLVRFAKWYERCLGRFSSINFCVTKAMQSDLRENWNIDAHVLYDRPPVMFKEADLETRHDLLQRLSKDYPVFEARENSGDKRCTSFTKLDKNGGASYVENRPAMVVSSTSWTEDEDFGLLLSALQEYELKTNRSDLPDILCVITGKGPQKEYYKKKIESQTWKHVSFCLPWLTTEDYPKMLGSADLGVCLHKSSSGLDLPMKVVDMFGCGLPVCAVHFNCLDELVKDEENGLVFKNSEQLSQCLQTLLQGFPSNQKLAQFRKNISEFQRSRWHDNWTKTVLPLFEEDKKNK